MIRIGKMRISLVMIFFMYVLIYNPPLFSPLFQSNGVWLMMVPSAVYLLLNRKEIKKFLNLRAVICTEAVLGAMLVYLVAMAKINGNDMSLFVYFIYWMAGDIPFALACWICLRKHGLGFSALTDHLLVTGLIVAVTTVAAFLIPAVKEFFTEKMIAYGMNRMITIKLSAYRDYGMAANVTSTAAYVQAMLACIALWRGIRGKPLWLIAFPVLAFSANINVRTSVYLMAAGMAAVFIGLAAGKDRRQIGLFFVIAVPAAAIAYFGLGLIRHVNPMTYDWLANGIEQVSTFVAGEESPYPDGIFGEMAWMLSPEHFPKGMKLIFGAGTEIMGGIVEEKYGAASDIGFMNDLWRGGLLYTVTVIILYLRMLWQMMKSSWVRREAGIFLALMCLFFFGITNIKGSFFIHSDLTAVIWLMVAALVWGKGPAQVPEDL